MVENPPETFPAGPPPDVREFCVWILWNGAEDKPFYRALLVSSSRAGLIADRPFWNYAVIGPEEFARLWQVLEALGCPLAAGPYRSDGDEYYVEIEADGRTCHCSLGWNETTGRVLGRMAAALEPDHRQPIEAILTRIGRP